MSLHPRLAVMVAGLLALVGGVQAQTPKRRDLVIWGIAVGPETKGQDAVIREFGRLHPDINLRVLSMGAGAMDPQKLLTSIVGNVAPDLIYQDRFSISDWASRGAFQSLDDLVARDAKDPLCPHPAQYYDAAWSEATYEGKVYGIPGGADDRVLLRNDKIFRESAAQLRAAGLDPTRAPRTWSEQLRYGRALTQWNPDGSLKRAGFMPNFGNTWLYLYGFQNNAEFMSADRRTCTLESKPAEEAMRFMIAGYDLLLKEAKLEDALQYMKDGTGPMATSKRSGYEAAQAFQSGFLGKENDAFVTGKVVMKTDGNWILNDMSRYAPQTQVVASEPPIPDDRYNGVGRFAGEKDRYITWIGGNSLAIPKGARNRNDAWEYIKFACSTEGRMIDATAQRAWEKLRGRAYIPTLSASRAANEAIFARYPPPDPKFAAVLKKYIDMMPVGRIRPATFAGQVLWNEHVKAMETALYKKASPKAALLEAQANVQRDLDAFFDRDKFPVFDLTTPLVVFAILVALALAGFVAWFATRRFGRLERSEAKWAYLFVSPWLFGFLLLTLGPMVASLLFSFAQYDVLNPAHFVGLQNYATMAGTGKGPLLKALGNAVYMAGLGVPLGLATGLAVALLLNTAASGMRLYRTFFYMPAIVPTTAAAVLWTWVLTPDANKGLINAYWSKTITPWLGVAPPAWIQSADWSKNGLVVMGIWGAGSGMILWLAGLKGISPSLYEASDIDGATPWKQFWSVTFPMLSPIIFFNTVMGFIGAMQEFDRQYIMRPSADGPHRPRRLDAHPGLPPVPKRLHVLQDGLRLLPRLDDLLHHPGHHLRPVPPRPALGAQRGGQVTSNGLYSVGTLLTWVGWVFAIRALILAVRMAILPLGGGQGGGGSAYRRAASKKLLASALIAGVCLLVVAVLPMNGGVAMPPATWRLPLVWFVMPWTAWLGFACLAMAVSRGAQAGLALNDDERVERLKAAVAWGGAAVLFAALYKRDPGSVIDTLKGGVSFSPTTALALAFLAVAAVVGMVLSARSLATRGVAKATVVQAALVLGSFVFGLPFAFAIVTSFKEDKDMSSPNGIVWIPKVKETVPYFDKENPLYETAFKGQTVQGVEIPGAAAGQKRIDIQRPLAIRGNTVDATLAQLKVIPRDIDLVQGDWERQGVPGQGRERGERRLSTRRVHISARPCRPVPDLRPRRRREHPPHRPALAELPRRHLLPSPGDEQRPRLSPPTR